MQKHEDKIRVFCGWVVFLVLFFSPIAIGLWLSLAGIVSFGG
jgi:hypothetical protein